MASTWGNNTWGSNEWQDDVILISPTGLSTTASLGTVEAFNTKGWGRDDFGNGAWGVEYSVALSGQQADTTLGTAVHGIGVPLEMIPNPPTGDQLLKIMRGQVGEITIGIGQVLDGQQADFATPTLSYAGTLVGWGRDGWNDNSWGESPNEIVNVVGQSMEANISARNSWGQNTWSSNEVWGGTFDATVEIGQPLTGQELTTNLGSVTFTIDSTPAITGQEASFSLGTLGLEFGPAGAVSGVSSTTNVGTLGLEFGPAAITGVSSTASVGELTIDYAQIINITGIQSTSAVGSIVPAIGVPLTGIAATSSIGSITPSDVMGLTGLQATFVDPSIGIQAYKNIDTGSNDSFSNVDSGSNTSYSDESTGSNDTYSNVATGSNTSYSDAA